MEKSRLLGALSACMFVLFPASSHAALISVLGGSAVYDSDLDITWLADANLALSNTFGVAGINATTGAMVNSTTTTYLAAMNADGGTGYLGISSWQLPTTLLNDATCSGANSEGTNCTGSDMGHLYYNELGGSAGVDLTSSTDPDVALFSNIFVANSKWRSSTMNPSPTGQYGFRLSSTVFSGAFSGNQDLNNTSSGLLVIPVFDGGSQFVVPIPAAVWLFGSGLLGLIGIASRKKSA